MGVTQLLARHAARRAHVLTVETPGYWVVRAAAERRFRARGWSAATSPADADVLAVCGMPGPELDQAIDRVWDQLPGPRVRIDLPDPEAVESALDRAAMQLVDTDMHRTDARERGQSPGLSGHQHHTDHYSHRQMNPGGTQPGEHPHPDPHPHPHPHQGAMNHHGMNHPDGTDHGEHDQHEHLDHDAMNHGQHERMDTSAHRHMHHGAMDMAPAGIALAEGGDDRDGLEMDVLHLRLGPVLCYWPAGLVVRCSLQGDVLARAEAWVVDSNSGNGNSTPERQDHVAARHCDHVVDLLALAGWPRAAAIARTARDALLSEPNAGHGPSLLDTLHGKLRRSRVLRWSLRDITSLTVEDCDRLGLPSAFAGDCYDRLLARIDMAQRALSNSLEPSEFHVNFTTVVTALPELVGGLDLATTRLAIASLGIDTAPRHAGGRNG